MSAPEIHLFPKKTRRQLRAALGVRSSEADIPRLLSVLSSEALDPAVKLAAEIEIRRRYYLGIQDAYLRVPPKFGFVEQLHYDPLESFTDEEHKKAMEWHFRRADLWVELVLDGALQVPWTSLSLHLRHFAPQWHSIGVIDKLRAEDEHKKHGGLKQTEAMYTVLRRSSVFVGFQWPPEAVKILVPRDHAVFEQRTRWEVRPKKASCASCAFHGMPEFRDGALIRCPGVGGRTYYPEPQVAGSVESVGCHSFVHAEVIAVRGPDGA